MRQPGGKRGGGDVAEAGAVPVERTGLHHPLHVQGGAGVGRADADAAGEGDRAGEGLVRIEPGDVARKLRVGQRARETLGLERVMETAGVRIYAGRA